MSKLNEIFIELQKLCHFDFQKDFRKEFKLSEIDQNVIDFYNNEKLNWIDATKLIRKEPATYFYNMREIYIIWYLLEVEKRKEVVGSYFRFFGWQSFSFCCTFC